LALNCLSIRILGMLQKNYFIQSSSGDQNVSGMARPRLRSEEVAAHCNDTLTSKESHRGASCHNGRLRDQSFLVSLIVIVQGSQRIPVSLVVFLWDAVQMSRSGQYRRCLDHWKFE
jgi:hypothetical protein